METNGYVLALLVGVGAVMWMTETGHGAPPSVWPGRRRGLIINQAADALVGCLRLPGRLDRTTPRDAVVEAFQKNIDQYAGTQVSHVFLNTNYQRTAYPSRVWESYWDVPDPETDTSGWPRLTWLVHETGVDLYAVCIARCREKGLSPWLSIRMNDTHYSNEQHKMSRLWWDHPEFRLRPDPHNGFDFSHKAVRDHYLALVGELLDRYDTDGLELDWMRFPWYFKRGEGAAGCEKLTEMMREARRLADASAKRRGHPVGIAARVPAVPDFAVGLGMDGVTWAREGLVDILILASVWRPSDTDQPIEEWRRRIGSVTHAFSLAAGTDLWLRGSPRSLLMMSSAESARGFTAAMLDRGADQIYLFNHFSRKDFYRPDVMPDGRTKMRNHYDDILTQAGRLDTAVAGARRHVVTWHDPAPHGADNPKPLPATVGPGQPATVRIYTGPQPTGGRVVIRAGLDDRPGMADAVLTARLNGTACKPIDDLKRGAPFEPRGKRGNSVVDTVAEVAPRVVQFDAPPSAVKRGCNAVEISLQQGAQQQIIWLEIYVIPGLL